MAKIRNPIIMVGGGATVQLYAPTISLNGLTLTITNSANNGAFVEGYDIYSGSTKIGTTTSTTYDLATSSGMTSGSNSITVKATAQGFIDSASSNAETVSIYTVTNTLSNITTSNSASIVLASSSYSATLTPATGWTYGTTTVTMGGNDITSTAYSNGTITIASVTGNIVVTATAYIPVTNTLTGVTNSNGATAVAYGSIYTGTITVSSGYTMEGATISITMGGVDITSTAYSNGTITIANVTSAVIIEISAVATSIPYILFQSDDLSQFSLAIKGNVQSWNGTIEYSTDRINWSTWDPTVSPYYITSSNDGHLYLRGTGNSHICTSGTSDSSGSWYFPYMINGNVDIIGNIETLLDYQTVEQGNHPVMDNYCYYKMFTDNPRIKTAPNMKAMTLSEYCYSYMFMNCTSLLATPELPATTLAFGCYAFMFYSCGRLATAPTTLPATTGAEFCYQGMFYYCSSLVTAPEIKLSGISNSACRDMFNGCTGLTTIQQSLYGTSVGTYGCYQMFYGCTSLTTPPKLPASTISDNGYRAMFQGCTSLTSIPALPVRTLGSNSLNSMLRNCSNIKLSTSQTGDYQNAYRVPPSAYTTSESNSFRYMIQGTGGTYTGDLSKETTYYTSNDVIS